VLDAATGDEEEEEDDNDLEDLSNELDLEKSAEQKAIVKSYESLKKLRNDFHAQEEEFEVTWRPIVGIFIEEAPIEEGGSPLHGGRATEAPRGDARTSAA
jgi:hypothetical protein